MATIKRKPKVPAPPAPPVTPPVVPPVTPPPPKSKPTATLGSYGNASIDQWDAAFIAASDAVKQKKGVRVAPEFMKAMMDVESGGNGNYPASRCRASDGTDNVPACGPMQIKFAYHKLRCPECDVATVPGQIELATHIIGDTMKARGKDAYDALVTTYFPGGDINGTSQKAYVDRVRSLVATMQGVTPVKPKPVTEADVLRIITNGSPKTYISFGFNQLNTQTAKPIYAYGAGHGLPAGGRWHPGVDIWTPDETPISAIFGGEVVCVGTQGRVIWDQGCGFFVDDAHGIGNLTILTDAHAVIGGTSYQLKMTYGHMSSATVKVGDRIRDGQQIGRSGVGLGWPHVHLDVVINAPRLNNPQIWMNGGAYHLVDPIPTIIAAMGGGPPPESYVDSVDISQPDDTPPYVVVKALRPTPVLQRGNPNGPRILPDLATGDTFQAQHKVLGVDGRWYWVGRYRGRVAEADAEQVKTVLQ